MFVIEKHTSQGNRLEKFEDLLQAFEYALSQACTWKLFFKTDHKPAKLLAYKEN